MLVYLFSGRHTLKFLQVKCNPTNKKCNLNWKIKRQGFQSLGIHTLVTVSNKGIALHYFWSVLIKPIICRALRRHLPFECITMLKVSNFMETWHHNVAKKNSPQSAGDLVNINSSRFFSTGLGQLFTEDLIKINVAQFPSLRLNSQNKQIYVFWICIEPKIKIMKTVFIILIQASFFFSFAMHVTFCTFLQTEQAQAKFKDFL